jgi:hypothetical protein
MGYDAQVLYVAFNRFLVAARPRAEATEEELRRQEFDAWREGKLMSLGGRADIKPAIDLNKLLVLGSRRKQPTARAAAALVASTVSKNLAKHTPRAPLPPLMASHTGTLRGAIQRPPVLRARGQYTQRQRRRSEYS